MGRDRREAIVQSDRGSAMDADQQKSSSRQSDRRGQGEDHHGTVPDAQGTATLSDDPSDQVPYSQ